MENLNAIFLSEAGELMADLEKGLLDLEANPAHTAKVSIRFFG